jgi:hypothetical protein
MDRRLANLERSVQVVGKEGRGKGRGTRLGLYAIDDE